MTKPYFEHIHSSSDLQTSFEAIRAGFVNLALERNRRATPFVAQARALKSAASKAKTAVDILDLHDIRPALVTAAGVSDKAAHHLNEIDKTEAIVGLIRNFLEPAGANFIEELVFRFLLTRGDTLGGSMRNIGGFMAQCKLNRCIIAHLKITGRTQQWLDSKTYRWTQLSSDDVEIEYQSKGLFWKTNGKDRTLIYNLTIPFFRSNVDLCLFDCNPSNLSRNTHNNAATYLALGELKGGIDPAGADEHWKTARTSLIRIKDAFAKQVIQPKRFFIGGAIEARMASEIWAMLQDGSLDNAANLTVEEQMSSISSWLCGL